MKTRYGVLLGLFGLALILGAGLLYAHQTVTVIIDGSPQAETAWALRVGDLLNAAGIPIYQGDELTPAADQFLRPGQAIEIQRASQIYIEANGRSQTLLTTERLPAGLIALAGIAFGPQDSLLINGSPADPQIPLAYRPSYSLQIQPATEIRLSEISLTENGETLRFLSTAATLGAALQEKGIIIQASDRLEPGFDTPLTQTPLLATLQCAQPITIQTQTGTLTSLVLAETTGEALAQAGMALQGLDYSIPDASAPLPADGQIRVVHVSEEISLETEPLPFGLQYIPLPEVELDTLQVVQVGAYGVKASRLRVVYEDGIEVARELEDEWIAQEPQPRIVGYGTQIVIRSEVTADGAVVEYWRKVDVYATRYSPCNLGVPDYCNNTTASGKVLAKGMIGVIRSWYNLMRGGPVYVPGYGYATIEDIGAGFADRHWIDLAYSDEEWISTAGWVTLYFLPPVPANIMWILE
jgi:uncharacterized protein YabE (DUF348 family)